MAAAAAFAVVLLFGLALVGPVHGFGRRELGAVVMLVAEMARGLWLGLGHDSAGIHGAAVFGGVTVAPDRRVGRSRMAFPAVARDVPRGMVGACRMGTTEASQGCGTRVASSRPGMGSRGCAR